MTTYTVTFTVTTTADPATVLDAAHAVADALCDEVRAYDDTAELVEDGITVQEARTCQHPGCAGTTEHVLCDQHCASHTLCSSCGGLVRICELDEDEVCEDCRHRD